MSRIGFRPGLLPPPKLFEFVVRFGETTLQAALGFPQAIESGELLVGVGGLAIEVVLGHSGSAQFPISGGHLLEINLLGTGAGLPLGLEVVTKAVVIAQLLPGEECGGGAKAVAEGIEADSGLAFGAFGSSTLQGITAVGRDLFRGSHR
jgi:hypothetical protein